MSKNELRDAALKYAKKGFSVIPVSFIKRPLVDWKRYQDEIASSETIEVWWRQFPLANVGIITGKISGISVVDIDPRNGGTNELLKDCNTPNCTTGGGGAHYYFQNTEYTKSIKDIYPGIEIRAEGNFVVAPPSKSDKGSYIWNLSIDDVPLAPLPEFLKEEIQKHTQKRMKLERVINNKFFQKISQGNRNDAFTRFAGQLFAIYPKEYWDNSCFEIAKMYNESKLDPPLSSEELTKTFESIKSKEAVKKKNTIIISPPGTSLEMDVVETNSFVLTPWTEYVNQNGDGEQYIIEKILKPGCLAVLGGHGKSGKSTLAIHVLNCIRTGKDFIYPTKKLPVIYINYEMSPDYLRGIIKDVMSDSPDGESASIINYPNAELKLEELENLLKNQPTPGVCVIDSFRGAFALDGDDENKAGIVGGILRKAENIARRTMWTILMIHHFRKEGQADFRDFQGSSEWKSAPDVLFIWSSKGLDTPGIFKVSGRLPHIDDISIQLSRTYFTIFEADTKLDERAKIQKVDDTLTNEFLTAKQLAELTQIPEGSVHRYLQELERQGKVKRNGSGGKNDPFVWTNKDLGVVHDSQTR
jgi:hypothetical protein